MKPHVNQADVATLLAWHAALQTFAMIGRLVIWLRTRAVSMSVVTAPFLTAPSLYGASLCGASHCHSSFGHRAVNVAMGDEKALSEVKSLPSAS